MTRKELEEENARLRNELVKLNAATREIAEQRNYMEARAVTLAMQLSLAESKPKET